MKVSFYNVNVISAKDDVDFHMNFDGADIQMDITGITNVGEIDNKPEVIVVREKYPQTLTIECESFRVR